MAAVIAVNSEGWAFIELHWQSALGAPLYSTGPLDFTAALHALQYAERIERLREETLTDIATLVVYGGQFDENGERDMEWLRTLAHDLRDGHHDELLAEATRRPRPCPPASTLSEILGKVPEKIRYGFGTAMVEEDMIEQQQMSRLLLALETPPQSLSPAVTTATARHNGRFSAVLRSIWPL